MRSTFCFIACVNLYPEIRAAVHRQGLADAEVRTFPSRCGSAPVSWSELAEVIEGSEADVVVVCGSYCLRKLADPPAELSSRCRINRQGQCHHLLLNPTLVDTLQRNGTYLLSPGWLRRWRMHIATWGFDRPTAIEFFGVSLRKLLLLDTGTDQESERHLAEFGDFLQLPTETLSIGLEYLGLTLSQIIADHQKQEYVHQKEEFERQAADSAMTLDLIRMVTRAKSKPEVVFGIVELFTMLFAPKKIHFIPVSKAGVHFDQAPGLTTEEQLQAQQFYTGQERYFLLNKDEGSFLLCIGRRDNVAALLLIFQVAYPRYINQYINTALAVSEVCALSIEHVNILKELCSTSRLAGKAEVATEVLHNVGNTLNSISVSSEHIREMIQGSICSTLPQVIELIKEHQDNLGDFFEHDPRGRKLPLYFSRLSERFREEEELLLAEADRQFRQIRRIAELIRTQQDIAKEVSLIEQIDLAEIVEESLELFRERFWKQQITVERNYDVVPVIYGESHKILQVINNLISNAVDAFEGMNIEDKKIRLRLYQVDRGDDENGRSYDTDRLETIALEVTDNGQGMQQEILQQAFGFGFTTKKDGHGFGLHNAANLTAEMRGTLTAESSGLGKGTKFRMELPVTANGRTE